MTDDRIQQLLDRTEITDFKYAYVRAADDRDAEAMVARFVADCTAEFYLGEMAERSGPLRIEGREALRDWLGQHMPNVVSSSHHVSNVEVAFVGPDTATMCAHLYAWQRFDQLPAPVDRHSFARCLDTWVRTPDGWRQTVLSVHVAGAFASEAPR